MAVNAVMKTEIRRFIAATTQTFNDGIAIAGRTLHVQIQIFLG